jgi:hypothetical protein
VIHARRTHRVGVVAELLAAPALFVVPDDQVAGKQKDLFPIFVDEGFRRKGARLDP